MWFDRCLGGIVAQEQGRKGSIQEYRYGRDSLEFSRVISLSDGVFAIAMTLLVLTIDIPDVPPARLGVALAGQMPQYIAVFISFGLVANVWWRHHQFVNLLRSLDPVVIAINLLLLSLVALIPFPTALIGNAPSAPEGVLPFIGLFMSINCLFMLLAVRANRTGAWRWPLTLGTYYWILFNYLGGNIILGIAFALAFWYPLSSLVIVATAVILGPLTAGAWYRKVVELQP